MIIKSGFLIFVVATLLQISVSAQVVLPLQITNANGNASLSWSNRSGAYLALQTATNLAQPLVWTDVQTLLGNAGTVSVSEGMPYQYFRMTQMIGLFEFEVFYNVNLEIDPGNIMTFNGPIFCNQNIWEGSSSCTFESTVAAAGTNTSQAADPFAVNYNSTGGATFTQSGQPSSHTPAYSIAGLGTNFSPAVMRSLLGLPPAPYALGTGAAYSSNGLAFLANECDLVITNFLSGTNRGSLTPTGTNMALFYQDQQLGALMLIPYDYALMTNRITHIVYSTNNAPAAFATNIVFAGYSWITNVLFYDWREGWNGGSGPGKSVQAIQIDVAKLNAWLTNSSAPVSGYAYDQLKFLHSSHHIDSIYVCDGVPLTGTQLPAVRMAHGAQLPNIGGTSASGLTVATPFPMYVLGDYNSQNNGLSALGLYGTNGATANTLPAALVGDAITVLSDSWSDGVTARYPIASSTTVNAAIVAGIVPSNPNVSGNYSGGMENFLRLMENWAGNILTYNGSMVVPFYSQYATNSWVTSGGSGYYNPPTRHWAFDLNFTEFIKVPPLMPLMESYTSP